MADDTVDVDEADRLKARRDRMSGTGRTRSPIWAILFFLVLIGFAAVFVVFPDQARRLL